MNSALISFWVFLALTVLFAMVLLWRLIPKPPLPPSIAKPDIAMHTMALTAIAPVGPDADSVKAIADAIGAILKSLGDFGSKLDTLGPTALLGIFAVVFALLTFACAWLTHQ